MKKNRETSVSYLALVGVMGALLSGCDHPQTPSSSHVAQSSEKTSTRTVEQMLAEKGHMNEDLKQGVELLLAGNYQEASKSFNLALFKDQTNGWIHYLNGLSYQLYAKQGDITQYDLAQAAFEQALKYDPNNIMASLQLARVYSAKKDFAKAQEELANVLIIEPNNKDAAYELAYVSYQMGDVKSASMAINRASLLAPQNPEVRRAEAMILAASGKGEKALEQLAQYQNLHKGDADARAQESAWKIGITSTRVGLFLPKLTRPLTLVQTLRQPLPVPKLSLTLPPPAPKGKAPLMRVALRQLQLLNQKQPLQKLNQPKPPKAIWSF